MIRSTAFELDHHFWALADAVDEAVFRATPSGEVVWANEVATTLFDYAPADLVGIGLDRLLARRDGAPVAELLERAGERAERLQGLFARTRAGLELPVSIGVRFLGRSEGFVCAIRDLRWEKVLESALEAERKRHPLTKA